MIAKEELEKRINSSPLFDIDKESSPSLYKKERYLLLENLTYYCRDYMLKGRPLGSYSLSLVETADECIRYYDRGKGDFLNYFNRAFKKKRDTEEARERAEAYRGGIKISDDDDKKIRKILRLAKLSGKDLNDPSLIRKIAEVMHVCEREVVALIRINADAAAVPSTVRNDDGDETELFDTLASDEPAADAALISEENVREIADELQRVFDTVQERQKKALSMMLTARYILACDCDYDQADRLLYGRQFYDRDFAEECRISGAAPTDAAIAEKCGVLPSSLSRTFKEFKKKFIKG